eukprot:gb/GEZJ01003736.1/.p1 GENE.gb/GEZJ01003736.1/~~gb/GEZJ01003736.1/.p1  ORF type:complete len:366 (+),score=31.89 gb/GEZJ01003736.1/:91-1098(+)
MDHASPLPPVFRSDPLPSLALAALPLPPAPLTSTLNSLTSPAASPSNTIHAAPHPMLVSSPLSSDLFDARWPDLNLLDLVMSHTPSASPSSWSHSPPFDSSALDSSSTPHINQVTPSPDLQFTHPPSIGFSFSASSHISSLLTTETTTSASSTLPSLSPSSSPPIHHPYNSLPALGLHPAAIQPNHTLEPFYQTHKQAPTTLAAVLSPKKPIQKQTRRYTVPKSSRYCHLCARHQRSVSMIPCGNVSFGLCQKSVCSKCIVAYELNVHVPQWSCPHCCNSCPKRAKCFSYDRQTARRRANSLKAKLNTVIRAVVPQDWSANLVTPASKTNYVPSP